MITTILLDLDNTLIENNMDRFIPEFLRNLALRFKHLFSSHWFAEQVLLSTKEMIANRDLTKTNQDVFFGDLAERVSHPQRVLKPIFETFYAQDFDGLKILTKRLPEAKEVVNEAFNQGYMVVVASNPIFPLDAMVKRLNWAGVANFPYALITSYESMHSCKPHGEFYEEILNILNVRAEECLMVGDDIENDLSALKIGIKTFLVTDLVKHHGKTRYVTTFEGTLKDFQKMLEGKNLP